MRFSILFYQALLKLVRVYVFREINDNSWKYVLEKDLNTSPNVEWKSSKRFGKVVRTAYIIFVLFRDINFT